TPQKLAVADARKGADMFRNPQVGIPLLGIVENMAYFVPDDAPDKRYFLFGEGGGATLAAELGVPLLAQIPLRQGISENADDGRPAAVYKDGVLGMAFHELSQSLARQVAIRNSNLPPSAKVSVSLT
ncbi:MAG: hypothetical protein EAZ89_07605, partial [Bacteroidetes bacterium]